MFVDYSKGEERQYLLQGNDVRYLSCSDAQMRLAHTIVKYKGSPVYVLEADEGEPYQYVWVEEYGGDQKNKFMVSSNDSRLDISSPRVGFINTKKMPYYLVRSPLRSQKQGLNIQDCSFYPVGPRHIQSFGHQHDNILSVSKAIKNDYPRLEEVLDRGHGAFSRTWAIAPTSDPSIFLVGHKVYTIGLFFPKEYRFQFEKGRLTNQRRSSLKMILNKKGSYGVDYHVE